MSQKLNAFEQQVVAMLLAGNDPVLNVLRQQNEIAEVTSREFTGTGFFTKFDVPDLSLSIPARKSFTLGDVFGETDELQHGASFALHVQNGLLAFLEGATCDEEWPSEIKRFKLAYVNGERDLNALRKLWS